MLLISKHAQLLKRAISYTDEGAWLHPLIGKGCEGGPQNKSIRNGSATHHTAGYPIHPAHFSHSITVWVWTNWVVDIFHLLFYHEKKKGCSKGNGFWTWHLYSLCLLVCWKKRDSWKDVKEEKQSKVWPSLSPCCYKRADTRLGAAEVPADRETSLFPSYLFFF